MNVKALMSVLLVAALAAGCVSAETQRALDYAEARLEAVQTTLDDLRVERAELAARLDAGILSPEEFQAARDKLLERVQALEVEGAVAQKEVEALKVKADSEKSAGWNWGLEIAETSVDVGASVAAALPFAPWLVPVLGALGSALGALRKKKGES